MTTPVKPRLLPLATGSNVLGTSPKTLLREFEAGNLTLVRIARRWMIPVTEIDRIAEPGIGKKHVTSTRMLDGLKKARTARAEKKVRKARAESVRG